MNVALTQMKIDVRIRKIQTNKTDHRVDGIVWRECALQHIAIGKLYSNDDRFVSIQQRQLLLLFFHFTEFSCHQWLFHSAFGLCTQTFDQQLYVAYAQIEK